MGAAAATAPAPAGAQPQAWTSLVHQDDGDSGPAPCSVTSYSDGRQQVVVLAAHAVEPAAALWLTCGIVQDGRLVASVTARSALVAAAATAERIPLAPYSVCTDVFVLYVDGSVVSEDGCPSAD